MVTSQNDNYPFIKFDFQKTSSFSLGYTPKSIFLKFSLSRSCKFSLSRSCKLSLSKSCKLSLSVHT